MGVPLQIAAADVRDSMNRLRHGLAAPVAAVADSDYRMNRPHHGRHPVTSVPVTVARDYIANFLNDPWLALNLANPFWWPQRHSRYLAYAAAERFALQTVPITVLSTLLFTQRDLVGREA